MAETTQEPKSRHALVRELQARLDRLNDERARIVALLATYGEDVSFASARLGLPPSPTPETET